MIDTLILGERIDKNKINKKNTADKGEVEKGTKDIDDDRGSQGHTVV